MRSHVYDGIHISLQDASTGHYEQVCMTYEGNTSEVPENDHEAPFLMEHVPGLRNAFFAFDAAWILDMTGCTTQISDIPCIQVQPSREAHESHVLQA